MWYIHDSEIWGLGVSAPRWSRTPPTHPRSVIFCYCSFVQIALITSVYLSVFFCCWLFVCLAAGNGRQFFCDRRPVGDGGDGRYGDAVGHQGFHPESQAYAEGELLLCEAEAAAAAVSSLLLCSLFWC